MRMKAVSGIVTVLLLGQTARAELSERYRTWLDGPEQFLVTSSERKALRKATTDAEAQRLIDLFWARRDPNPSTRVNELRLEFDARVAQADREYGFASTRGCLSDRGRLLIVLGPPDAVAEPDPTLAIPVERGISSARGRFVEWVYARARLPKGFRDDVRFRLVESTRGANNFQIIAGDRQNADAYRLLSQAPERLLLRPDLQEVPKAGLVEGARDATTAELAALDAEPRPWPDGASVHAVQGLEGAAHLPLWVHVLLPPSVPPAELLVGRVTSATGEALDGFAVPARPVEGQHGRAYELSIPLDPGRWRLDLALLAAGSSLAVTTAEAEIGAAPASGVFMSPLYTALEAVREPASRFAPWMIGPWHVVPPAGNLYPTSATVSAFSFVLRPPLDQAGSPRRFRVILEVFEGDRKVQSSAVGELAPDRLSGDVWVFAFQFKAFPRTGTYRTELRFVEPTSGVQAVGAVPMTVVAPPSTWPSDFL